MDIKYSPKKFRQALRRFSDREVSKRIGMSRQSVARYRAGIVIPGADVIGKVAALTGHQVSYFFVVRRRAA